MSKARRVLKNLFSLTLAEVATKGITFFSTAYLARIVLTEGFGQIGFVNAYVTYFTMIVSLGLHTVGTREIAIKVSMLRKYVNSILTFKIVVASVLFFVVFASTFLLDRDMEIKVLIWIASFNLFSNAIMLDWVYRGLEKMEILAIRQIATSALNLGGVLIFVHSPDDIMLAVIVQSSALMLNAIWMLLHYIKNFGKIKWDFELPFIKKLLASALPVGFSDFFILILSSINLVMLGIMRTDQETGIFNAALKILILSVVPSAIIQGAFFPLLSRMITKEEKIRISEKYISLIQMTGSIVSATIFVFAEFIIVFVFSDTYIEAVPVLRLLMISSFFAYISSSYNPALIAWKKEKKAMYAIIAGGITSIISNYLLIPEFGPTGAAYASILSEFTIVIILLFYFKRETGKLFLTKTLRALVYVIPSVGVGYLASQNGLHTILAMLLSLLLFVGFNLIFKTFTIAEIKTYIKK
ncbi:MAG: flippase [Candidatus Kapaibacterium sp.]